MAIDPKININENQVIYKRELGHNHDGLTSTLIDYTKYSIFDFAVYPVATPGTRRRTIEETNVINLKSFIVSAIEERVLNPQGIRIQANAITAREIVSGTITANELASNVILVNNIIKSNNYVAGSTGWAINGNGAAEFSGVTVRGNVYANSGSFTGTITSSSGTIGGFALGSSTLSATSGSSGFGSYATITINSNGEINSYYQNIDIFSSFYENVKINAYASGGSGAINVTGTASGSTQTRWYTSYGVYNPSDIRLKNILDDDIDALNLINRVKTTKFIFKNDESEREHYGFIAQQVNEHIPYIAIQGGDDPEKHPWGIVQENFIPYLVKSIQQLTERIEILESKGV